MKTILAATAAILFAAPAQAGQDRLFDRMETAVLDCADYPSQITCTRAAGAVNTYHQQKEGSCSVAALILWSSASVAHFTDMKKQLVPQLERVRKDCGVK